MATLNKKVVEVHTFTLELTEDELADLTSLVIAGGGVFKDRRDRNNTIPTWDRRIELSNRIQNLYGSRNI